MIVRKTVAGEKARLRHSSQDGDSHQQETTPLLTQPPQRGLCVSLTVGLLPTSSLRKRMSLDVSYGSSPWFVWVRSGLITEMRAGLLVSDRPFFPKNHDWSDDS